MRPFFSFYGSKWRAARLYPPPVGIVVEPFAGAAGYSTFHNVEVALLYDLDEAVCGVWDYLIHVSAEEVSRLPDLKPGDRADDLKITQEARWLIGYWCNPASAVPKQTLGSWCRQTGERRWKTWGRYLWGARVRSRIAAQLGFIRRWQVRQADYSAALDLPGTWFIDPPYSGKPGRQYRHNMLDYDDLATFCRSRRGLTIVCENRGADWLPFEHLATIQAGGGSKGGSGVSHEAVWCQWREPAR